jgi:DNA invertase Pin-like site-specific DNA recombinase
MFFCLEPAARRARQVHRLLSGLDRPAGQVRFGLDAQRQAVRDYLDGGKWTLLDEFVEVESGKRNDRPELEKALVACKKHRARLVIAKLDRLSRDLAFIATLMERKVDFIAVDNPTATKFTIDILAAVAEHERDAISARSKAALAAAKAKGKQLGNYQRIAVAKQQATAERAEAVRPAIAETAHLAQRAAAAELSRRSIRTASGKPWHAMQIIRPCDRLGL